MTPESEAGIADTYDVCQDDSVHALAERSEEFGRKPNVMRSGRLVELCEQVCMDALRPHIAEHECTLGTSQHVDHRGPIVIGAQLTIVARCMASDGRYSEWHVEVHDAHEMVGSAVLSFVIVDQHGFEAQRVRPKQHAPGPTETGRAQEPT